MSLLEMVDDVLDESIALPPSINGFHIRAPMPRMQRRRGAEEGQRSAGHRDQLAMVLRALGEDKTALGKGDRVTINSIRNHAARHFPVQQVARATYREIVERRAREAQIDFVNGVATALAPPRRLLVDGDENVDGHPLARCSLLPHPLIGDGPPEAERLHQVEELRSDQDAVEVRGTDTGPGG